MHEVIAPNVIATLWPESYARSVHCPAVHSEGMSREGFSQSRPFFGCFIGTFSPSRRHSRSTRLSLTCQPASRNSAAILPSRDIAGAMPCRAVDSRIGHIAGSVRSCWPPTALRLDDQLAPYAVWIGVVSERDTLDVRRPLGSNQWRLNGQPFGSTRT